MARILVYDLEVSSLDADRGVLLCVGYKFLDDDKVTVLKASDYKGWNKSAQALLDDSRLWRDFLKVYVQADMVIGYFSKGFDQPYFYSKLLKHGFDIPANLPHVDLFYVVKSNMRLTRKSMDNVTRFLDLQDEEAHKTPVALHTWLLAERGDEQALEYIVEHCRADILLTEKLYHKIKPLVRQHPRINGWSPCRTCGDTHLQRRGYAMTTTRGRRIRIVCTSCGSWDTRSEQHAEGIS